MDMRQMQRSVQSEWAVYTAWSLYRIVNVRQKNRN